jgi:hypothetical protein
MKKIFAIIMTISLLTSVLCVPVLAADDPVADAPAAGVVLRVSALKKTDSNKLVSHVLQDFERFQDGWNFAMKIARDDDTMEDNRYERIVVDIYTDWIADDEGDFTDEIWNGKGFKNDTIYVPADAKVTLNLNGHTIDRGLTDDINNGEVMFINDDADIIINNGTIKGGFSNSEGGGLYIEGAMVTLNNVNITGNTVEDDDGAGIAAYGGTTLMINGGSISDNLVAQDDVDSFYGGAIYIEDSTAVLTGVTIKGNAYTHLKLYWLQGAAIYSENSSITMTDCVVQENGLAEYDGVAYGNVRSIIYANDSQVVIKNTDFIDNGHKNARTAGSGQYQSEPIPNVMISAIDSDLTLTGGNFTGNDMIYLFMLSDTTAFVEGVDFTDNDALSLLSYNDSSTPSVFANCAFGAGTPFREYFKFDIDLRHNESGITFEECTFKGSTIRDKNAATFLGGNVSNTAGSIFGEGSLSMIVAILALVASAVSIFLIVDMRKKPVPAAADKTADGES